MESILVTIGDAFSAEGKEILEKLGTVTYSGDLETHLEGTTVLVTGLDHTIEKSVLDAAPNLKCIATPTTGLDHIDLQEAEARSIPVLSLRGETAFLDSITATGELACGLMIALARHIVPASASVLQGKWDRKAFQGTSLGGKTLGIIGYGRLGKQMARFGEGLGMNVLYSDPVADGAIDQRELLEKADVVSLHVHLTEETEGMIGKEEFLQMKSRALLINTSRGKIVDEDALIDALEEGNIAGYATDVLAGELEFDGSAQSKLIDYAKSHENVLITPHIGGMTDRAREATDTFIASKVSDALS